MMGATTSIRSARATRSVSGRSETHGESLSLQKPGKSKSHGPARRGKISAAVHLQDQVLRTQAWIKSVGSTQPNCVLSDH